MFQEENKIELSERELEHLSSAYTLSDMEIFIYPDLMYSLVIANILSPELWQWRNDPWFKNIEKKSFNYKLNRVKQYIMDHFSFNLDLDTWGLTTKDRELARFKNFVDMEALSQSNALFGYEGDKYYFELDIRRHFGLDKYTSEVIPYWKTETLEAMKAFKYKEGYSTGAGECVSLAALYIAALFVVGQIPLEKMFMIATPLHSQNYIAEGEGFMTNNRRIVTKKMWYNGTELSAKARRAVEKEKITIVSHISGYIHTLYKEASINPEAYQNFKTSFKGFLNTSLNFENFANYLYANEKFWKCFQYAYQKNGKTLYIPMQSIFNAQRSSKNRFDNESRTALLQELEAQEFNLSKDCCGSEQGSEHTKILINDIEDYLAANPNVSFEEYKNYFLNELFSQHCGGLEAFFDSLREFLCTEARLPKEEEKDFVKEDYWDIAVGKEREDYINYVYKALEDGKPWAQNLMYTYRDMRNVSWQPFIKAVVERNPLGDKLTKDLQVDEIYLNLQEMDSESIYEEDFRLALPDEVWNFKRGDGIEKALALINILKQRGQKKYTLEIHKNECFVLENQEKKYRFATAKKLGNIKIDI